VNDSWTSLAASPDYHYHSQAVYFSGKIYNIGGYNENLDVTDTTRIYDIDTNTWRTGAPMPQALAQMATALWDGVVYVAGGNNFTGRVNTLYAYDIASNTWTTKAPMLQALTLSGFGAIDGKLYIAGGSSDAGYLNTLYIYDIATNVWTLDDEANLPQAIARPGSSVLNGRLYLYGGRLPDLTPTTITQIYDPVTNTWDQNGPLLNVPLFSSYGTAFGNDSIVAPGGLDVNFVGLIDNEHLINTPCGTPTPTPTATPTPTLTPTATATATATPTATPTPRPSPSPRPRPTPRLRPAPPL
jgi:N-acetylneuraminic acid mutarotase